MSGLDRHVRRTGRDYLEAFMRLLPLGEAWPRFEPTRESYLKYEKQEPGHTLWNVCRGLCEYWGFVDSRAADLLERETDPRLSVEMFVDWERNWGLPDPCFFQPDNGNLEGRRALLMLKMTLLGGQSRAFFEWVARKLGYTIRIREYSPFMVGISRVGGTLGVDGFPRWQIGPPEMRFYWTVSVAGIQLIWFRVTAGIVGVDPHLRMGIPEDLECLLNRWKPAQTQIVFDLSGTDAPNNPMAGTP